jgi:riboflavin biosynthesis pyrimidine reductase
LPGDAGEPDLDALYALPSAGTRHVRANFVASLDGAIEVDGRSGVLGGRGDKQVFHLLRALTDVVLVGAGTVRAEGYGPAALPPERQAARRAAGQRVVPPIAVVTGHGLPDDLRLLTEDGAEPPLVLTTAAGARTITATVRRRAEVLICGDERVDPALALEALADRGLTRVLCEGGPTLVTALMRADLLDELCLTVAPTLAGPERARLTAGPAWTTPRDLRLVSACEQDGDLLLRYQRSTRPPGQPAT